MTTQTANMEVTLDLSLLMCINRKRFLKLRETVCFKRQLLRIDLMEGLLLSKEIQTWELIPNLRIVC